MKKSIIILFTFIGLLHLLIGFILAGAGHGWVTGFFFSLVSVIFYPLIGYLFTTNNRKVLLFILLANVCLTFLMIIKSKSEGNEYFLRMWQGAPFLMICYFLLWFGWGILALITLFKKRNELYKSL